MQDNSRASRGASPPLPLSHDSNEAGHESEKIPGQDGEVEDDEEYVLLDLEEVFHGSGLPSNYPYTLSGLDTMNPILTLGDGHLKLIGDYEETVGTCLIFTEHEEEVPPQGTVHPLEGGNAHEPKQGTKKRINSLCKLERKLKFRIMDTPEKVVEHIQ